MQCKLVEHRRKLMARQIKLRRDQQKAWKAQQQVNDIEEIIRSSTNFDIHDPNDSIKSPKNTISIKKPRIKSNPKVNISLDTNQLLRNTIEARQIAMNGIGCDFDKNNENRRDTTAFNMPMPMPIHPMLSRQLRVQNG